MQVWASTKKNFFQSPLTSITSFYSKNSAKTSRGYVIHFAKEKTVLSGFAKITHQVDGQVETGCHISRLLSLYSSFLTK